VRERNAAALNAVAVVNSMDLSLEAILGPFHDCPPRPNAATGTPPPRIYLFPRSPAMTGTSGRTSRPVEVEICLATSTGSLERPLVRSKLSSSSTCIAVDRFTLEHVFNSSD
jgi:hypothetical protein